MSKKIIIGLMLLFVFCCSACGKEKNGSPLANKEYSKLSYDSGENEFGIFFQNILFEYSDLLIAYADCIGTHELNIKDGQNFSTIFDDYEKEMDRYYKFMYEILNFDKSRVPDEYINIWNDFSNMIADNKAVFETAYDEEVNKASDSITQFMSDSKPILEQISAKLNEILDSHGIGIEDLIPTITLGETISTEWFDFTLNKVELSYDVKPDSTSTFYSHYPADPGQVYIHIDADVKNLSKTDINCDEIYFSSANYNDGYLYEGFAFVEDTDGDFTYANITAINPLQTLGVHNLIDCPEEVNTNKDAPLFIIITLNESQQYKYIIRE